MIRWIVVFFQVYWTFFPATRLVKLVAGGDRAVACSDIAFTDEVKRKMQENLRGFTRPEEP